MLKGLAMSFEGNGLRSHNVSALVRLWSPSLLSAPVTHLPGVSSPSRGCRSPSESTVFVHTGHSRVCPWSLRLGPL